MVFSSSSTQLVTLRFLGRLDIVASCRLRVLLDAQSRVDVRELTHAMVRSKSTDFGVANQYEDKVRVWSCSFSSPPPLFLFPQSRYYSWNEYPQD